MIGLIGWTTEHSTNHANESQNHANEFRVAAARRPTNFARAVAGRRSPTHAHARAFTHPITAPAEFIR
jgi:hypothetical protein